MIVMTSRWVGFNPWSQVHPFYHKVNYGNIIYLNSDDNFKVALY
jgi:hypothetical protein